MQRMEKIANCVDCGNRTFDKFALDLENLEEKEMIHYDSSFYLFQTIDSLTQFILRCPKNSCSIPIEQLSRISTAQAWIKSWGEIVQIRSKYWKGIVNAFDLYIMNIDACLSGTNANLNSIIK